MKEGVGRFILRLVVGLIFASAGLMKLLDLGSVTEFLNNIGMPFPSFMAIILALGELIGGLALILGIFVKYASILLAFIMVVAVITVHLKNGFNVNNVGLYYSIVLIAASLTLMFDGAGAYSLSKKN